MDFEELVIIIMNCYVVTICTYSFYNAEITEWHLGIDTLINRKIIITHIWGLTIL